MSSALCEHISHPNTARPTRALWPPDGVPGAGPVRGWRAPLEAGHRLQDGAFVIERVLGRGGFGVTYRAWDARRERMVAIKEYFPAGCARCDNRVQPPPATTAEAFAASRTSFLEEAHVLCGLRHPNIVRVHGYFEENATAYMVMEFLEGETLLQRVERSGPLPEDEAIATIEKIAGAVDAIHRLGLLHLDIKPENVFVCAQNCVQNAGAESDNAPVGNTTTEDDATQRDEAQRDATRGATAERVVLMDFDLLQKIEAGAAFQTRPLSHTAHCGTPGYAPPEQYSQSVHFGVATDVYALGATLHHLLTGHAPPSSTERALFSLPLDATDNTSRAARGAIKWAMQIRIQQRPQSVRAFLAALRPLPASESVAVQTASSSARVIAGSGGAAAQMARPPSSVAAPASSAPRRAGDNPLRVRVSIPDPQWPSLCACCGAPGDDHLNLSAPRGCRVPYCARCLRHARATRHASAGARWGMILGLVITALGFGFSHLMLGPLLGSLGVVIHFTAMAYWVLKNAVADTFTAAGCCDARAAVLYGGMAGSAHRWSFANRRYADEFRRLNAAHIV